MLAKSLNITRPKMNNVEINFKYEGQHTADIQPIHTGRASIIALF